VAESESAHFMAHHVEKFCGHTPSDSKVIGPNTQNFKSICDIPLKKNVGGPHLWWCVLASLSHSLACVQISGHNAPRAEIWSSAIVDLG